MESYKLNENISLTFIPMTKLKTTSVGIYIGRELKRDEASANALLPYVLMKGCKEAKSAPEMSKYLENLYGAKLYTGVTKRGDNQFINFEGEVISDRYTPNGEKLLSSLIKLMLSVIFEPLTKDNAFIYDIVEREKVNCINKINGLINDKRRFANKRCLEEMFSGENFSISEYGYKEEIEKITSKDLYNHYTNIIGSSAINIFISGELNIHEVKSETEAFISDIIFNKASLKNSEIIKRPFEKKELTETTDIVQGKLSIGFRTNISATDEDFWSLVVANNIYGGGLGSKLFNNVREKLSLAYYASTTIDRYKGYMLLNAGIAFDKLNDAKNEIFFQLTQMQNGQITDDEINNAKSEIINSLNSCYDDQNALASYYMGNIIAGVDVSIEEYKENIMGVTKAQVIAVSKKLEPDTVYFLKGGAEE